MIYLYCILPAEINVDLDGLLAIEEAHSVYLLKSGTVQAAVSEVGRDFAEANLNARVHDLDWLSPRAVRHHEVVDGLYTRCHWLLPLTFGAIFRSEKTLHQRLQAGQTELRERLERLRGREEWDLRLSRDEARFAGQLANRSAALRQVESELNSKPPGTRFLLEKKLQNLRAQEAKRLSAQVRTDVQRTLAAAAIESHQDDLASPPQAPKIRLELRSAYLIEERHDSALKAAAEGLSKKYADLGYSLEITGPWPAFSFAGGLSSALS